MNIELPFVDNPIVKCYLHHAHTLGIIQNEIDSELWVFSHFLQLFTTSEGTVNLDFYIDPYNYECLDKGYIHPFYLNDTKQISDYIKNALCNGYYILCLADEYYIKQTQAYKQVHFDHWMFIYGCSEDSYKTAGFTNSLQYKSYNISFDVFNSAIKAKYGLTLYKTKQNYKFNYDKNLADELMYDYLHAVNTSEKMRLIKIPVDGRFGYKVYDFVKENLERKVDIRYPYIIYEHKIMVYNYLIRCGYKKELIEQYKEVIRQSEKLKNMYIKETIFKHSGNIDKLKSGVERIKQVELDILKSIL